MAVDDLWYLTKRGPDDEKIPSKRHGRGKRWRVRWIDDSGKPRTELFERKADADRKDANVRADLSRGQYIDDRAGKVTVQEFGQRWRGDQLHRESTENRTERAFRLHIDPVIGHLPMNAVRQSHIKGWVKDRSKLLAPTTLHVVFSHLVSMFTAASVDRMIGVSPCIGVRLPDIERGDYWIPTPDQVHALAQALAERRVGYGPGSPHPARRLAAIPYVPAGCGLRPGETFGLEVDHIDFLRREVKVEQQLVTITGQVPYLGPPKTKTSRRTVELPAVTAAALAEHIRMYPPKPVEIEDRTNPRKPVRRMARLLFTNVKGQPLHTSSWTRQWVPAVAAVDGVPDGFGLHGLRHYFATLLIHSGASIKTVQLALGHSSPTVTLNTYVHEWPDVLDRTRSLVDAALGQTPASALAEVG
jgi:integrase